MKHSFKVYETSVAYLGNENFSITSKSCKSRSRSGTLPCVVNEFVIANCIALIICDVGTYKRSNAHTYNTIAFTHLLVSDLACFRIDTSVTDLLRPLTTRTPPLTVVATEIRRRRRRIVHVDVVVSTTRRRTRRILQGNNSELRE